MKSGKSSESEILEFGRGTEDRSLEHFVPVSQVIILRPKKRSFVSEKMEFLEGKMMKVVDRISSNSE